MSTGTGTIPVVGQRIPHERAILAVVLLSYFMILLDNSVIFTGLPSIQADLGLSPVELTWAQDAYTLVFGGLLLLGARAGDLWGRRRVFVVGLAIFALASLLIGLSPAGWWMIAGRALQGVGAAIVAPSALSLLTASFPAGPVRSRAIALYAATAGIGASLGMLVGGAAAEWVSWRAGFLVNVPIGIAMIVLAPRYLAETHGERGRLDVAGAILATAGVGALVFGIVHAGEAGWTDSSTLTAIFAGVLLLGAFVVNEARASQPIVPLRLFANARRASAYAARFLYMGAMIGFFFFTTQLMQRELGMGPLEAGLGFLPMTLVNFVVALAIPRLVRRVGEAAPLVAGVALTLAGMAWLAGFTDATGYVAGIAMPMVLIGVGQGLAFAPLTSMGIADTRTEDAGAASGVVNTVHQLGMALGLGILAAVAHAAAADGADVTGQVTAALAGGTMLLVLCFGAVVGVIVPVTVRRRITAATITTASRTKE